MSTPSGSDAHHLVEQNQTSKFGTRAIQNTANIVNLPDDIHDRVGAIYSSKPAPGSPAARGSFTTYRQWTQSLSYDEQRQVGIDTVRQAMKQMGRSDPAVLQQLDDLEKMDDCTAALNGKSR